MNSLKDIIKFWNLEIQESQQLNEATREITYYLLDMISESSDAEELNLVDSLDEPLNEGILTGLLGGLVGATAGAAIMRAVCNVLKISNGPLYDLLTSKLVCGAVGVVLGK